jgi:predicted RNase H-like HicB family nuclease
VAVEDETMREYNFPVVIEYDPEEDVYLADCPLLPGCYTDGRTYDEAMTAMRDAIRLVIESRLAVGDPVPTQEFVTVAVCARSSGTLASPLTN